MVIGAVALRPLPDQANPSGQAIPTPYPIHLILGLGENTVVLTMVMVVIVVVLGYEDWPLPDQATPPLPPISLPGFGEMMVR